MQSVGYSFRSYDGNGLFIRRLMVAQKGTLLSGFLQLCKPLNYKGCDRSKGSLVISA